MNKSNIDDFIDALKLLDSKIGELKMESIKIKAIGGFAMLYHGFRKGGYTIDIDSLTERYNDSVTNLIKEVGKEKNIDEDWLNTDCALLDGFMDLNKKIKWIEAEYQFNNIKLLIADINGLIRSKAKAIHDGGFVPRTTDKKDLLEGLRYVGLMNISELDASKEYGFIEEEYGRCYRYLREISKW